MQEERKRRIVVLITKMGLNRLQVQNQERAFNLLQGNGVPFETLDGSDPANREM